MNALFHEDPRKVSGDLGEHEQEDDAQHHRDQERINASVNSADRGFRNLLHHEDRDRKGRENHAEAVDERYHDAGPDRVVAEFYYDRERRSGWQE